MVNHPPPPQLRSTRWQRWQRLARRIRIPLGFLTAGLYLFELWRHAPQPAAIAWSALLVVPGLALRGYASGYVKKNRELTVTGPYAYTRNPLYLGTLLVATGLAIASRSFGLGALFAAVFLLIYLPVIQLEEQHLRRLFADYADYAAAVPAIWPRVPPARWGKPAAFRWTLYLRNQEYNAAAGFAAGLALLAWKVWR